MRPVYTGGHKQEDRHRLMLQEGFELLPGLSGKQKPECALPPGR